MNRTRTPWDRAIPKPMLTRLVMIEKIVGYPSLASAARATGYSDAGAFRKRMQRIGLGYLRIPDGVVILARRVA